MINYMKLKHYMLISKTKNDDYIDLEINSVKMSISKQDFQKIMKDFFN